VYGAGGEFRGASVIARDVSERKRLDEHLLHADRVESLGQLAGGVAHDFNNLVTAIIAYADLAMAELPPHARACDDLMQVRDTAERAASLAQRLLAYSRKRPIKPEYVDVSATVRRTQDLFQCLIGDRIELAVQLAPDCGMARIDASELEQIVLNLVLNARDALPDGGRIAVETGTVALADDLMIDDATALPPGTYATLTVTDDGTGMTRAVRRRVFEPFFTTKREGNGTGLGLANCRRIARRAGGGISVHSESGYGTMFRVFIPRVDDEARTAGRRRRGDHDTRAVAAPSDL
jgi:signal transduction histidine kinase